MRIERALTLALNTKLEAAEPFPVTNALDNDALRRAAEELRAAAALRKRAPTRRHRARTRARRPTRR